MTAIAFRNSATDRAEFQSTRLSAHVAAAPTIDRRLLLSFIVASLLPLVFGLGFGLLTALARGGLIGFDPETAYRVLTLHGTSAFFWWLYLAQVALMLGFAAGESPAGLKARPLAYAGLAVLILGLVVSEGTALARTPLLYDANPALGQDDPTAVAGMAGGYLLLGLGLVLTSLAAIVTVIGSRNKDTGAMTAMAFGVLAWAGFLIVSAIASVNAFLPNLLWAFGLATFPASAATEWHILFHNLHYLPLMATVLTWYALTSETTATTSAFGSGFSKLVFASYLVFVPPTSLYHMFLEPDLAESVRVAGSLLSLFVSVPTLIAFLIIVSSLELSTRARGAPQTLFGWIGRLPWGNPAFAAMGVAIVSTLVGLVFAFVLIQEKFAPLISDTVFVPGYFHFFAVGAVTETFLAGFLVFIPALTARSVWRPRVMAAMPWLIFAGLIIFGASGILAGFEGVPRRTFDISYDGQAPGNWQILMRGLALGGTIFAIGLAVEVFGVARTLIGPAPRGMVASTPNVSPVGGGEEWGASSTAAAWTGPIAVVAVVLLMTAATIGAFELMHSLPIDAVGGHSGH
jgi:cytochrome c oxidase subunit 1